MLPAPDVLKRITQSPAMLDAILEEEWEYRYFSFDVLMVEVAKIGYPVA
jgi:hypothetical protein